jgi:GPH family glycoside/pentoside/hexuronide:cation symporter
MTHVRMLNKIGYAAGDLGISISYFAVGFFFMYYLTDVVGMAPLLAGTVIFIGKLWDGANDPLIGILNDRTKSRHGRKRAYIIFGAIPFAISFLLLWMIPSSVDQWFQFILATMSFLFFATAYSFVAVPYMALVPIMTHDYDERTQITGIRAILSTTGTILGGGVALLVSSFSDKIVGLRTMAFGFAALLAICLFIAAQSVKGMEARYGTESVNASVKLSQYFALFKEKNVLILLIFKFLGAIATGCLIASIPYFARHILANVGSSTYGVVIYTAATALLIPIWNRLTHLFDKRRLLLIGNGLGAVVLLAIGLLMKGGYIFTFYIGCGLLGAVTSAYLLIPYSLVPDLVDFHRHKTGERHESVFFGLWMTIHQIGLAIAGLLLGVLLSVGGYQSNSAVQTDSAILAIRLAFGLIPGIFLLSAALVLQKYGITRKVYQEIQQELQCLGSKTSLKMHQE